MKIRRPVIVNVRTDRSGAAIAINQVSRELDRPPTRGIVRTRPEFFADSELICRVRPNRSTDDSSRKPNWIIRGGNQWTANR